MLLFVRYFSSQLNQNLSRSFLFFLMISSTFLSEFVMAQQNLSPGLAPSTQTNSSPNNLTQAVVQAGVLSCASRVEQVTRFAGFGPNTGASLMIPSQPVDLRLFSIQMEISAGVGSSTFVDMNFAPQQANGCGASYEAISYWPQNCEALATSTFAQFKKIKALFAIYFYF